MMDKYLTLEAKRALSLAGWKISDREGWPGPEASFLARSSHFGRSWAAPVVCADLGDKELGVLLSELGEHFSSQLERRKFGEVFVVVTDPDARSREPDALGHHSPCFLVQTPDQLPCESIDFRSHLHCLKTIFDESSDGLASYSVRPRERTELDPPFRHTAQQTRTEQLSPRPSCARRPR
ncbi:hypothetical protein J7E88_26935 [Streptomyces sp. ISL-10]|uniref:hypothetical protein n=1 Tax=Streptomyces sp. ISL-10 TaxID=2819172 RepID=UPI001BE7CED8|nr:hypothetical protein [Streptomyces sp. ISL-10]MBT2368858.1 hypothetical protein [Streptomyces sp. ISL-10]